MSSEWPTARHEPLKSEAEGCRRIEIEESVTRRREAAATSPPTAPLTPTLPEPGLTETTAYERLARVLAEALAAWWRRTQPDDPDLAR